jgi:hypothetical protein
VTEPRVTPRYGVEAPQAQTPAAGLLSLANVIDEPDERWTGGYDYQPELPPRIVHNKSQLDYTDIGANLGSGLANTALVVVTPWMLEVEDRGSTFQLNADDLNARVNRMLVANTSRLLERELWTGEIKALDSLPNPVLARSNVATDLTGGTAVTPQKAVSRLVQAVSDSGVGDCMVHTTKATAIQLPDGWRSSEMYEDYGFVVVAGAGYLGTDRNGATAAANTSWMYATGKVNVRLTDIEVTPGQLRESILTTENTVPYRARRIGAADFAGPVFACQVQL